MFRCAALVLALGVCGSAHATLIEFETELLSGQRFRTTYTVTNDVLPAPLQLFDIEFDVSLYEELSLTPVSGPAVTGAWDEIILGSAAGVPAAYDVLALDGGIAAGATFGGFAIEFDWLGTLSDAFAATQTFLVYDAATLDLLETGITRPMRAAPTPVSEPGTLALFAGLLAFWGFALLRYYGRLQAHQENAASTPGQASDQTCVRPHASAPLARTQAGRASGATLRCLHRLLR